MNFYQRWSQETKANISGVPNIFTQLHSVSAAREAPKLAPHSFGKCASSEPENPLNKASVSRCQAFSSVTQSMSAELAVTSKMPHCGKPPLPSRSHNVPYHIKHRSKLVKDAVLNGSTHREACKQIQSQDILKSRNNVNHLFNRTSYGQIAEFELPSSAETLDNFQGDTIAVLHRHILNVLSGESEVEADGGLTDSWQHTRRESDSITFSKTARQSSSVSAGCSHSPLRQQSFRSQLSMSAVLSGAPLSSDGCSVTPLLKQRRSPHVMPTPPGKVNTGFSACTQGAKQCPPSLLSSGLSQRQTCVGNMEDGAFQNGTSNANTLRSRNKRRGPYTSKTSIMMTAGEGEALPQNQECQGAAAAEVPPSSKDCDGQMLSRFKRRMLEEPLQDNEEEKEKDRCRICYSSDASPSNPLLSPCLCSGSLLFIHLDCLKTWLKAKIHSGLSFRAVQRCEICKGRVVVDPNVFDLKDCYMRIRQGDGITGRSDVSDIVDIMIISGTVLYLSTFNSQPPWMRLMFIPCMFACLMTRRKMRRTRQMLMGI